MNDQLLDMAGDYLDQSGVILAKRNPSEITIDTPELFQIINPGTPIESRNSVVRFNLSEAEAPGRIKAALKRFRDLGLPSRFMVTDSGRPKNLAALLQAEGPANVVRSRGFAIKCSDLKKLPAPHVTVEELSAANLDDFILAVQESFAETPSSVRGFTRLAQDSVRTHDADTINFLARYKGQPAGIGRIGLIRGDGWAAGYIGGGGVRPRFRHRPVIFALSHLAEYLQARGINLLMAHAREERAAPLLRRFGFREFGPADYYYFAAVRSVKG